MDQLHAAFAESARQHRVPQYLLERIAERESSYRTEVINCKVVGRHGELGIMQLHPGYYSRATACNPRKAIDTAAAILRRNFDATADWWKAVAAYNFGLPRVLAFGRVPDSVKAYADFVTKRP